MARCQECLLQVNNRGLRCPVPTPNKDVITGQGSLISVRGRNNKLLNDPFPISPYPAVFQVGSQRCLVVGDFVEYQNMTSPSEAANHLCVLVHG